MIFLFLDISPGDIPLDATIRQLSDEGAPIVVSKPDSPQVGVFHDTPSDLHFIYRMPCKSHLEPYKFDFVIFFFPKHDLKC